MRSSGRSSPRALTRDEVVQGAIRVIGRTGPYASMGAIAEEMGVAKPRLYRLFSDKSDLDRAIADWMVREIYRSITPDISLMMQPPRATVRRFLEAYTETIAKYPNLFRFLALTQVAPPTDGPGLPLDVGRRMADQLAERGAGLLAAVGLDTDGVDYLTRGLVGFVVSVTDLWLGADGTPTPERTAQFVDRTTESVCALLGEFLLSKNVVADPDTPVVATLAAISQSRPD
ncbi:TetR/AcrR family transcriptional regulator [Nocardia sp. NPDC005978]|uniref:TetR/AcrR family transcriptional regulator n=1 Tax=unclassified Nocardia TaxID=2637762 RepID=UPI0033A52AB6